MSTDPVERIGRRGRPAHLAQRADVVGDEARHAPVAVRVVGALRAVVVAHRRVDVQPSPGPGGGSWAGPTTGSIESPSTIAREPRGTLARSSLFSTMVPCESMRTSAPTLPRSLTAFWMSLSLGIAKSSGFVQITGLRPSIAHIVSLVPLPRAISVIFMPLLPSNAVPGPVKTWKRVRPRSTFSRPVGPYTLGIWPISFLLC